ncbi:MAG: histidine phosphatase family protein [Bacillota bacterium]
MPYEPPVIYGVRHAETQATLERRYEGRGDSPLTERGISQARLAARTLETANAVAVYTSPSTRAMQTSRIIADRLGLRAVVVHGLAEASFGEWEGMTYEEIRLRDPVRLEAWFADPLGTRPPGGESLTDMWARVRATMLAILRGQAAPSVLTAGSLDGNSDEKHPAIAIVSHGGPLRALMSYCRHGDLRAFWTSQVHPGEVKRLQPGEGIIW